MSVIVDINHELGNLSQYNVTSLDGGHLSVQPAAALKGNYGISCLIADTNIMYAQKNGLINTSNKARVRLYLDPNSIALPLNTEMGCISIANSLNDRLAFASVRNSGGNYAVSVALYNDAGTAFYSGNTAIADGPHYIEFYLQRATTNVSVDGNLQWWIDGVSQTGVTGIDNYDRMANMDRVSVGAGIASGVPVGAAGTLYLDELVVNDDGTLIGPVSEWNGVTFTVHALARTALDIHAKSVSNLVIHGGVP